MKKKIKNTPFIFEASLPKGTTIQNWILRIVWIVMDMTLYFQTEIIDSKRVQLEVSEQSGSQRTTQNSEVFKKLEPSTFHPLRHVKITLPQEVFPSPNPSSEATADFVLLRIHRRLGRDEPLDDPIVALLGCQNQWCSASGSCGPMAQAQQAEPNGTHWEKKL